MFQCACCGKKGELFGYVPEENGLVCKGCARGSRHVLRTEASAVYALQFIVATPIEKLYTFTVSPQVLEQISGILDSFRKKWTDHEFKSLEILESL